MDRSADVVVIGAGIAGTTTAYYLAKKGISVMELLSWWGPMESGAGFTALSTLYQEEKPDLVVSGINRGANLGQDVYYSGTVAAAREPAHVVAILLGERHFLVGGL